MHTLEPQVDSFLTIQLNKSLLKHAAGSTIFCPACNAIMDCRKTVLATVHRTIDGNEECVQSITRCGKCWDTVTAKVEASVAKVGASHPELKPRLEIVDGRIVFKRNRNPKTSNS